ncbi:MAG: hypothetical protein ACQEV7_15435 [Bacillota bacterium]
MDKNSEAKLLEELEKLHVKVDRLESQIENSQKHKAGPLRILGEGIGSLLLGFFIVCAIFFGIVALIGFITN